MTAWITLAGCVAILAWASLEWRNWNEGREPFREATPEEIEAWERWFKESGDGKA